MRRLPRRGRPSRPSCPAVGARTYPGVLPGVPAPALAPDGPSKGPAAACRPPRLLPSRLPSPPGSPRRPRRGPPRPSPPCCPPSLADPGLRDVVAAAGRDVAVEGPDRAAARSSPRRSPPTRSAGAEVGGAGAPVLVVTATEREAEELATAVGELLGPDEVAYLPSWETLPHERLSPRADTVGRRVAVLRRLAHPEAPDTPDVPLRVVVTATRSLIQPVVPGLGDLEPVRLAEGTEYELEALTARLVDLAYARVEMVEKRGEFAVRGGIVDLFPPTAAGAGARGVLGRRGLGAALLLGRRPALAARRRPRRAPGRGRRPAVPRAAAHRRRCAPAPRELAAEHTKDKALVRAAQPRRGGHPVRGHGVADPRAAVRRGRDARARPAARAAARRRARR